MDVVKLQTTLIEMSKSQEFRDAILVGDNTTLVLASSAEGPAMTVDLKWFVDQLPNLIPMVFSVVMSGGSMAFIPVLIPFLMKMFNVNPSVVQDWITKILTAIVSFQQSQQSQPS